ncbi:MAG: hypothetical protein ABI210_11050 [Abditibacteriaceae bacterium]
MRLTLKLSLLIFCCILSTTAFAQDAPWSKVLSSLPHYQRLEGTLTVQGYQTDIGLGGGTAVAKIQFEQPDSLRIEMQANPSQGTRALIVVAQGNQTESYDPVSRSLRMLPFNIVDQWWRGSDILHGGPANALFATFSQQQLTQFYSIAEDGKTNTLSLLAVDGKSRRQPDFTRVGGSGNQIFYAPFMENVWDYPPQLNWKFGLNGLPLERDEGVAQKVLYKTAFTFDPTSHLPKTAVVTDFKDRHIASFTYDLKETTQPFDKSTFIILNAADQIPEDTQLKAPADYRGQDAITLYNKGVALAVGQEDYAGAYEAWQQASKADPKAVAPWFALYESALQTHDLNRAKSALDQLSRILGADNEAVLIRQAFLAASYLQWKDAEATLNQLIKEQPDNAQFMLALASLYHSEGKTGVERGLLEQILAMPNAPAGVQAAAILNWSLNALTGTDRTAGDIDDKTPAQKLAKQIAALVNNPTNAKLDISAFADNSSLLTALALVQEEMGQTQQAVDSWTAVTKIFPYPMDATAQWHLLSLAAQRNNAVAASRQYDVLRQTVFGRDETSQFYNLVINIWQKAFGQDGLHDILKGRALAMRSTADDAGIWEAFQSNFGSDDDVTAALKNSITRFPQDAWWHSVRADSLSILAASPEAGAPGTMSAAEALDAALQEVNKAIALDPQQPYYQIQKTLILRSIANPNSPIIDPHQMQKNLDNVSASYQQLLKQWPDASDVQIAADIARLPLDDATQLSSTLESLQNTLYQTTPLQASYQEGTSHAGGNNHLRAFTVRQAKASTARRMGNFDAMTQYYQELLVSARGADEEQGVALNYLRQLVYRKDTPGIAALLTQLSHEPWKWKPLSDMMNAAGGILAFNPPLANEVTQSLQNSPDPYAHWAAARLSATMVASLNLVLQNPKAPDSVQGQQNVAMQSLTTALTSLTSVVDGNDKILAARAASALGESALERGVQTNSNVVDAKKAADVAAQWFSKALAVNPGELSYDENLIMAFHTVGDDASAKSARNVMLAKIPLDPEAMRIAAKITLLTAANSADKYLASKLAVSAFLLAQTSTTTPVNTFWHTGITAARCLMAAGNMDQAQSIYQQLSLPQWTDTDRAVAFLDWQYQLKQAGQDQAAADVQQKLENLGLNNPQMKSVEWNWHTLD